MSSSDEGSAQREDWSSEASFESEDESVVGNDDDLVEDINPQLPTDHERQDSSLESRRVSRRITSSGPSLRSLGRSRKKILSSSIHDQTGRAYADALRSSRSPSGDHRTSISVSVRSTTAGAHLSEDTRRRHRESKRRMECAGLTERLLFHAQELDHGVHDAPLWLHASIVPPRWRIQIMAALNPVHQQMQFCQDRVVHAWQLLLPPFDRANLHEFEQRLRQLDKSVTNMESVLTYCQAKVRDGEREAACLYMQSWYRCLLAKRGFYTKSLTISRHHRGLIPGMFDTIPGTSRLIVDKRTEDVRLQYPTSPNTAKYAFKI